MSRLIDADALLNYLEETTKDDEWIVNQYNADWIYTFIDMATQVDAVPVVRCNDCQYALRCDAALASNFDAEDYCSRGKRVVNARWEKEDENDTVVHCSNCLIPSDTPLPRCQCCRAVMDEQVVTL